MNYRVGFGGLGLMADNTMSLPGVMQYVLETSFFQTLSIPGQFQYYDERGLVWILTHWQICAKRYPSVGEKINIATWPVRFKGYFCERAFEVTDASGESILFANSNWILLDRVAQKPVRAIGIVADKYGEMFPFTLDKDFSMPKAGVMPLPLLSAHAYTPTRRDIDTNNHVNNRNIWSGCIVTCRKRFTTTIVRAT